MAGSNLQSLSQTQEAFVQMCSQAKQAHITIVLCLDPPYTRYLQPLNSWIAGYAAGHHYKRIDFYSVMNDPNNPGHYLPQYYYDGVHPNGAGYKEMGESINLGIF